MRRWIGSASVQIMACRLFGPKTLSKPMLGYCKLAFQEPIFLTFNSKCDNFHSRKRISNYRFRNGGHFCPGGDKIIRWSPCNIPSLVTVWPAVGTKYNINFLYLISNWAWFGLPHFLYISVQYDTSYSISQHISYYKPKLQRGKASQVVR